jgi:hypothetical protein
MPVRVGPAGGVPAPGRARRQPGDDGRRGGQADPAQGQERRPPAGLLAQPGPERQPEHGRQRAAAEHHRDHPAPQPGREQPRRRRHHHRPEQGLAQRGHHPGAEQHRVAGGGGGHPGGEHEDTQQPGEQQPARHPPGQLGQREGRDHHHQPVPGHQQPGGRRCDPQVVGDEEEQPDRQGLGGDVHEGPHRQAQQGADSLGGAVPCSHASSGMDRRVPGPSPPGRPAGAR